jgi:hypothetical protein
MARRQNTQGSIVTVGLLGKYMASSNMHLECIMDDLRLSTNLQRAAT